jgi:electron transfer flavoprotein alpha subunit
MTRILIVAEIVAGSVKSSTLSAITFARKAADLTGGSFSILALGGAGTQAAAATLAAFGAQKVLVSESPHFEPYLAEQQTPTVASVAKGFDLVCATASSYGKDLLPRVAARLDAAYAGDCSDVSTTAGKLVFKRPMYAGNAYGHVTLSTSLQVVTIRQSEFAAGAPSGGQSPIETVAALPPSAAASRIDFISFDQVKSERPELGDAKRVVSGGRALKDRFFEVLDPLATQLGAGIGASRAACDAGYAPGDLQVGQTGKIVAPELYIAVGISGAIQHIAGMKNAKTIVAINKDPEAPIFQIADYGWVADLFDAVPRLTQELQKRKA